MKETISSNEKSFHILNKLILDGFYNGSISSNRIELERKNGFLSASNHIIIGILNNENKFELCFDFKFPTNIVIKIAIGLGVIFSIVSIAYGNWLFPILFYIIPFLVALIIFQIKKKKEINLLTSKFLELYKAEYE